MAGLGDGRKLWLEEIHHLLNGGVYLSRNDSA